MRIRSTTAFVCAEHESAFYRETQDRREAMLDALERQHRQQERELRQESAQLNESLTGANFFVREGGDCIFLLAKTSDRY